MVESYSMGLLHLSFNITSHNNPPSGPGWAAPPTAPFTTALYLWVFFFYSLLSGSLTLSLSRCECIDSQSARTKWKQAAHLCPRQAKRACNQNNIKWLKKERDGDLPYQWNRCEIMQLISTSTHIFFPRNGNLTRQPLCLAWGVVKTSPNTEL